MRRYLIKTLFLFQKYLQLERGSYLVRNAVIAGTVGTTATGLVMFSRRRRHRTETVVEQANKYIPVQSDSEKAAGHPIVGSF